MEAEAAAEELMAKHREVCTSECRRDGLCIVVGVGAFLISFLAYVSTTDIAVVQPLPLSKETLRCVGLFLRPHVPLWKIGARRVASGKAR